MGRVAELLEEAQRAGLEVTPEGDRLRVRGPRKAEPLAKKLLGCKWEVLQYLQNRASFHDCHRLISATIDRISRAYVPGTIDQLKAQAPDLWTQIKETEREVDHACLSGRLEDLKEALRLMGDLWAEANRQ